MARGDDHESHHSGNLSTIRTRAEIAPHRAPHRAKALLGWERVWGRAEFNTCRETRISTV